MGCGLWLPEPRPCVYGRGVLPMEVMDHPTPDGGTAPHVVDLRSGGRDGAGVVTADDEVLRSGPGRRRVAIGLVVAATLFAGVVLAMSGGDADEVSAPEPTTTPLDAAPGDLLPGGDGIVPGAVSDPIRFDAAGLSTLADHDVDHVAYPSADGVVLLDLEAGTASVLTDAVGVQSLAHSDGWLLMADGRRTLAVRADGPAEVVAFATRVTAVPGPDAAHFAFVADTATGREAFVADQNNGSFGTRVDIPVGADVLAVPGLGVLVVPAGGGTYLVTASGYRLVSEHPVVAAVPGYRLELRCVPPDLACTLALVADDGGQVAVAVDVLHGGSTPQLSPDGTRILGGPDGATVVEAGTGYGVELQAPPSSGGWARAWSPDSAAIVSLGIDQPTTLLIDPLDGGLQEEVNLSALGLPAPTVDAVVIAF